MLGQKMYRSGWDRMHHGTRKLRVRDTVLLPQDSQGRRGVLTGFVVAFYWCMVYGVIRIVVTMADMDIRHGHFSKAGQAPILHTYTYTVVGLLSSVSFPSIRLREGHRHRGNRKTDAIFKTKR